jgi:MerR family copper efflux transcriptional regulator
MRIGEFARHTGIPAATLRRYEAHGLLAPLARDHNGYRRYAVEQLPQAAHLHALVAAGLPPAVVRELVATLEDPTVSGAVREARRVAVAAYLDALRAEPTGGLLDLSG